MTFDKDKNRQYAGKLLLFLVLFLICDIAAGEFLTEGLERYFGLNEPAPVLCIGHSHTVLGLDKVGLEQELGVPVAKYAQQGAGMASRMAMIEHYLAVQPDGVQVVVYDVDDHTFTGTGLSANAHRLFYPFMGVPAVDAYIRSIGPDTGEYWLRRLLHSPRFNEVTISLSLRGWLKKWTNLKFGQVDLARLRKRIARGDFNRIAFHPESIRRFGETVRLVRSRGIQLVLLYLPTIDVMNNAMPEKHRAALGRFEAYAAADPGITFLNYNPDFAHRYELFYDPVHLNPEGQKLVTERLAGDLKRIIGK